MRNRSKNSGVTTTPGQKQLKHAQGCFSWIVYDLRHVRCHVPMLGGHICNISALTQIYLKNQL